MANNLGNGWVNTEKGQRRYRGRIRWKKEQNKRIFDREAIGKSFNILEKEAELLHLRPEGTGSNTVRNPTSQAKAPKLEFEEGRGDTESYLLRLKNLQKQMVIQKIIGSFI
ncbi:hypothetical protein PoB_001030400 [Plakobranchus ocellatus]|uniref:AP2/ERF domain-containing protein n=1 Tax=Plakobranchus ocellatus TaxID=259542 RepID=A0AAV3YP30_9GAST|nr:hypothetical protein PoB_001030400 [Plakobranchus ocellatus]